MRFIALFLILFTPSSYADELKLHVLRSPLGINWSTPWKLAVSTLKNQVAPVGNRRAYSISHVFVEVKCDSTGKHILRGMTSATNTEERDLLLNKKYGLGIMFHTYKGKLEKDEGIHHDLNPYAGSKRRAELTFKVSPEACERMLDYAQEYEDLGYGNMYSGLQADPLKREGAGCSAFAVSFMKVAGLMDDFTQKWKKTIDVPKRLIGGPMTGKRVKLTYLLTRTSARWNSYEPHVHLEAWDPETMHSWIKKTYFQVLNNNFNGPWPVKISREKNTFKVELDMSNREVPTGSFWID